MSVTEMSEKGRDLLRGERLQIMLDTNELAAVDDFRFANRMPSRAAAVRELLRRGLEAIGYNTSTDSPSKDYGVLNSPIEDLDNSPK